VDIVRILVAGATGYVGSRLVAALVADGHDVLAATRDPDRLTRFGWYDDITPVALDAADPASVTEAFAQAGPVDVVYYLVHGIGQPDFRAADNRAAANVAAAAKDVNRIVYLGGFVPVQDTELSDHLAGRAEVAKALAVEGGPELVRLGAAVIIGAGSTSFEMVRYVGDRFWLIPMPKWVDNAMDPISIRDVLHYLVAAADPDRVPAGGYDIRGPETTTYRGLITAYAHASGTWRAGVPVRGIDTALMSRMAGAAMPVPSGLAADLVESLDHTMTASADLLRAVVPDPPGGLTTMEDAMALSLSSHWPLPANVLADPHHLADSDPVWAGGDTLRIQHLASLVTPSIAWPALRLLGAVPGPVAGAVRTGLDMLINLAPGARST
jgi:uncharacterized protein YbjT (DUF2867 family)